MNNPTLEETETILYSNATDRSAWEAYTNDPVWQRRLEALGATCTRERNGTKWYALADGQVLLRKGKRKVSETQRAVGRQNFARRRETLSLTEGETPNQGMFENEASA